MKTIKFSKIKKGELFYSIDYFAGVSVRSPSIWFKFGSCGNTWNFGSNSLNLVNFILIRFENGENVCRCEEMPSLAELAKIRETLEKLNIRPLDEPVYLT